jgi:hypothetical protein
VWHEITTIVPLASLPAWLSRGWTLLDAVWPYGMRGDGVQARVAWAGVGEVPWGPL